MKTRDIVMGLVVLIVLIAGVLLIKAALNKKTVLAPSPVPSVSDKLNKTFPGLNIPAGIEKADLRDVSGGNSMGIATRTEIVANLPDLPKGQIYQVSLQNPQGKTILLGTLRLTKSGWLLEYDSSKYPGYNKIVIIVGQKHILEGSF